MDLGGGGFVGVVDLWGVYLTAEGKTRLWFRILEGYEMQCCHGELTMLM